MRFSLRSAAVLFVYGGFALGTSIATFAQDEPVAVQVATASLPDAPAPENGIADPTSQQGNNAGQQQDQSAAATAKKAPPPQPKRILGVMPNYRAVSAGVKPPPFTPHEAFMVATRNSFDYSSFVFVGITSLLAEGANSHSQLGKGVPGYWAYYWRGWVDKSDGNYWVDFAMPSVLHQDERYYAMGEGGVWKRSLYAATRVVIAPNSKGKNGFNTSEVVGRGISQAISLSYYPSQTQTFSGFAQKFGFALGRDAVSNVFRELWPDINARILHHQHT
jgi:hypothetical protein